VVDHLPSKPETLSSDPNIAPKQGGWGEPYLLKMYTEIFLDRIIQHQNDPGVENSEWVRKRRAWSGADASR
jgi:hypothetical protein